MQNKLRVAIVGSRGIPAEYGGFETFAEHLSSKLASFGYYVTVYCENKADKRDIYHDVNLSYSKYIKTSNPLLYYFDSIRRASRTNDVLIAAGTGGSLFYFIPLLRSRSIITNIDGLESQRRKWPLYKKLFIKITEFFAIYLSNVIIADADGIKKRILKSYKINPDKVRQIEYGAEINSSYSQAVLDKYSLMHNGYYLVVSRLEPENNIKMIIEGYLNSKTSRCLVIIGNLIHTRYVKEIMKYKSERVRFLGGIYDQRELKTIRCSCSLYLHGHSVGGTNPTLLEALGSGNLVICHDNEFNREVTENRMYYFTSASDLALLISDIERSPGAVLDEKRKYALQRVVSYYNWERIADEYRKLIASHSSDGVIPRSSVKKERASNTPH